MSIQVLMPALSPTMEEGALAKWLIREGDTVKAGDVIAEIETDKATMEVEAVDEGVVGRLLVPAGSTGVKVNTPIAVLLEEGENAVELDATAAASAPAPLPVEEASAGAAPPPAERASERPSSARLIASPLARRIAGERGIDLAMLSGSGPHGRIVRRDVDAAVAPSAARPPATTVAHAPSASTAAAAPMPIGATNDQVAKIYADRPHEVIALDGMRRTIAARLTEAKQTIPHFYLRRDIELDALLALRAQINSGLGPQGVKLSVNDFIIKACAAALAKHPDCNAVWAGDRVLRFSVVDLAVAVAVEGGLFTPVIRDASGKSISALSAEMRDLAERARNRRLAPSDYQGGSFAISNLGMFGIDNFDAVINPPHAAILAIGAGLRKPIVRGEQIDVATVMSVTLSVDHRVIDGALGAAFLGTVKDFIETPLSMLV